MLKKRVCVIILFCVIVLKELFEDAFITVLLKTATYNRYNKKYLNPIPSKWLTKKS